MGQGIWDMYPLCVLQDLTSMEKNNLLRANPSVRIVIYTIFYQLLDNTHGLYNTVFAISGIQTQ